MIKRCRNLQLTVSGLALQEKTPGGIPRVYREILPRMCQQEPRLSVTLLAPNSSLAHLSSHPGIRWFPQLPRDLRPGRVWRHITPSVNTILQWLATHRDGIWHATYYELPPCQVKATVVTFYDMIHERYPCLFDSSASVRVRAEKQRCAKEADAIICISETTKQDLLDYYGISSDRCTVTYPGCDEVFRPLGNTLGATHPRRQFLLYVGGRYAYKGFDTLLGAFAKWHHREQIPLVVVGRPWTALETELLLSYGIRAQVVLLGTVTDEQLCSLYNAALAFIYPSLYEGFGIPLLEAMACGCPIVASRIPSTLEVAGNYPTYFQPGAEEDLRTALDTALQEGRNPVKMIYGLERAKSFSWDKTAAATLQIYRRLEA